MTTPKPPSQMRNPSLDLSSDVGQKVYTGALERRLLLMTIRDVQLRSVCELATGRPYDSFNPDGMSYDDLLEHVVGDLQRGLNLSKKDARDLVERNKITSNATQAEGPISGTS